MMFQILFARLGVVGCTVLLLALFFIGRAVIVAWRDTNGNGVIDANE